jgi:hypothetical protein
MEFMCFASNLKPNFADLGLLGMRDWRARF